MIGWQSFTSRRGGLRRWLSASGSLSARLAATGEVFSVHVLSQGRQPLTQDEALALGLGKRRLGYAREVVLRVDGKPMVFARSVTAHANAMGAWRSVQGLGNRPLADVLFRHLGICRAPLEFAQPKRHSPLQRHVSKAWFEASGAHASHAALPARRSVFTRHRAALLVMEVFAADAAHWQWPDDAPIRRSNPRKLP